MEMSKLKTHLWNLITHCTYFCTRSSNIILIISNWYFVRNPYEERTAHAYHVYSGTGHGSWGYSGMVSWSGWSVVITLIIMMSVTNSIIWKCDMSSTLKWYQRINRSFHLTHSNHHEIIRMMITFCVSRA